MKKLAFGAAALGLLAAGPVNAGPPQAPPVFADLDECLAAAAAGSSNAWILVCVPTTGGWTLSFVHKRKMAK